MTEQLDREQPLEEARNPSTEERARELLACPLCADPMELTVGEILRHVTPVRCLIGDYAWPIERLADWNTRATPPLPNAWEAGLEDCDGNDLITIRKDEYEALIAAPALPEERAGLVQRVKTLLEEARRPHLSEPGEPSWELERARQESAHAALCRFEEYLPQLLEWTAPIASLPDEPCANWLLKAVNPPPASLPDEEAVERANEALIAAFIAARPRARRISDMDEPGRNCVEFSAYGGFITIRTMPLARAALASIPSPDGLREALETVDARLKGFLDNTKRSWGGDLDGLGDLRLIIAAALRASPNGMTEGKQ